MKKFTAKLIVSLLSIIMVLEIIPTSVFAQEEIFHVHSALGLREALAEGHTSIAIMSPINLNGDGEGNEIESFEITKDTTIYLNNQIRMESNLEHIDEETGYDPIFMVNGASLVIDVQKGYSGSLEYSGFGSPIELIGNSEAKTSLTIYNGSLVNHIFYDYLTGGSGQSTSIINVKNTTDSLVDIYLYGGSYQCQVLETHTFDGPVFTGSGYTTTIKGGMFYFDPSNIVEPGYVAIKDYDNWFVTALNEDAPQGRFAEILDNNGTITLNRYKPGENELETMVIMEELYYSFEENSEQPIHFYPYTFNTSEYWAYASLLNPENGDIIETRKVYFNFEYDESIKADIDILVQQLNYDEEMWGYYYTVNDLELINYWTTWTKGKYNPEADMVIHDDNVNAFLSYSSDFRKDIGYKNFKVDMRAGYNDMFTAGAMGIFEISYKGTVYSTMEMIVEANHIIYVPDETTDILSAAQKRIDDYLGAGKVTLKSEGNLVEYFLKKEYEYQNPDISYEEWKNSELCPEFTAEELTWIMGTPDDVELFTTTINEIEHYLLIYKNSEAMVTPEYKNIDFSTEVSVSTSDASVPLDTLVEVNALDNEEQNKVLEKLGVTAGESFDIKLHSGSINQYVTKLENGSFEVALPINENLEGTNLTVYYLDEEGNVTVYPATVKNGFAIFTTDHFSVYTLAPSKQTSATTDINGDSATNICDLVKLSLMVSGKENPTSSADINTDGTVDLIDLNLFKKILLNK